MTKYVKLTDKVNKGKILKLENTNHYEYIFGKNEWMPTAIFIDYYFPDGDLYEEYEEISEEEAEKNIAEKKIYYSVMIKKAIEVATKAHENQVDKAGEQYIKHLEKVAVEVAKKYNNLEFEIVAWLHDVLEDSNLTEKDLRTMGFDERIIFSVKTLTKKRKMKYLEYVEGIKRDEASVAVKIEDLKHNMNISRIKDPSTKDFKRIEKYKKALKILENSNK